MVWALPPGLGFSAKGLRRHHLSDNWVQAGRELGIGSDPDF